MRGGDGRIPNPRTKTEVTSPRLLFYLRIRLRSAELAGCAICCCAKVALEHFVRQCWFENSKVSLPMSESRDRLVLAATELFLGGSFHNVGIAEICARGQSQQGHVLSFLPVED